MSEPTRPRRRRVLGESSPSAARQDAPEGKSGAALPELTLYRREGCRLCEDLESTLFELVEAERFVLRRVDIDSSPPLQSRYNALVPVLMHGNTELCHHFLDLQAVQQVLASYNS